MNSYQELRVWQQAIELVTEIYWLTKRFPKEETYDLTAQMHRAAVSIPSNIAEGWGRGSRAEYIRFLKIARGSLLELETQLIIAQRLTYLPSQKHQQVNSQVQDIGKMLQGLIKSLENRN